MSSENHGSPYQEISFNKENSEDESNHLSDYDTFNTKAVPKEQTVDSLTARIKELQVQLKKEKEKSSQLQKRNQQLTDMLVSASQSSVKRNQHFIKEVERKVCNFKALKDLNSSSFKPSKELEEKEASKRMMTETGYESTKNLSVTKRQVHPSKSKFDSNKENSNHLNDRMKTETQFFSKSKYSSHDLSYSQANLKERKTTRNFETEKAIGVKVIENHGLGSSNINLTNKSPILSPFSKNLDSKIFNKLEHKLMRM